MPDLEEAIARVIAGPERKSRMIGESEKRTIAFHEMGHAMVGMLLEHTDPVHKISVVSRGMALGWTLSLPSEDKYLVSKAELQDQLAQILGGRCAEELILGENYITTGASDDIRKATELARKMVTEWGMSDKLGPLTFGTRRSWSSSAAILASSATTRRTSPERSTRRCITSSRPHSRRPRRCSAARAHPPRPGHTADRGRDHGGAGDEEDDRRPRGRAPRGGRRRDRRGGCGRRLTALAAATR